MSSSQVIDTAKRENQLEEFFKERTRERQDQAISSAQKKRNDVLHEANTRHPGKYLTHVDLAHKLAKMNPNFIFEQSKNYPDRGGIYIHAPGENLDDLEERNRNRKFVTGIGWGMVPENSIPVVRKDTYGDDVPMGLMKGWRDTLKVLIQMRMISATQAEKVFGSGGKNWWRQLHN